MNKIGTFKITESFNITGRGRVAVGQIIEGKVTPDCYAYIEVKEKNFLCQIVGVNLGNVNSKGDFFIGLLLKSEEINLIDYSITEQVIEILKID